MSHAMVGTNGRESQRRLQHGRANDQEEGWQFAVQLFRSHGSNGKPPVIYRLAVPVVDCLYEPDAWLHLHHLERVT